MTTTGKAGSTTVKDSLTIAGVILFVVLGYIVWQLARSTDQPETAGFHPELGGGNMDQAMAALADLPEDFETLVQMGNQFMDNRNYAVAAEIYKRALAQKEVANIRVDYGACLHAMGLDLRALEEFRTVLAQEPTHAIANFNMGIVFSGQHMADSAIFYFNKYLELEPDGRAAPTARQYLQELGG